MFTPATHVAAEAANNANTDAQQSLSANSADVMSRVMSQVIAQMATGQIVSCFTNCLMLLGLLYIP